MTRDQSKMSLDANRRTSVYTEESQQKCPFVCRITKTCWFTPLICLFSFSRSPPRSNTEKANSSQTEHPRCQAGLRYDSEWQNKSTQLPGPASENLQDNADRWGVKGNM